MLPGEIMKQFGESDTRSSQKPAELPETLHRRLDSYALAASAAGVAALACALPADAAPACKTVLIDLVGAQTYALNPADQQFAPFNIAQSFTWVSTIAMWNRGFLTPNSAGAFDLLGAKSLPAALVKGESIGPNGRFGKVKSYGMLFSYGTFNSGSKKHHQGNFQFGRPNYFGFKFSVSGKDHYGWVRLGVSFTSYGSPTTTHIDAYGYETTPNTAINAGQCSAPEQAAEPSSKHAPSDSHLTASVASPTKHFPSLGILALGAVGVPFWLGRK